MPFDARDRFGLSGEWYFTKIPLPVVRRAAADGETNGGSAVSPDSLQKLESLRSLGDSVVFLVTCFNGFISGNCCRDRSCLGILRNWICTFVFKHRSLLVAG